MRTPEYIFELNDAREHAAQPSRLFGAEEEAIIDKYVGLYLRRELPTAISVYLALVDAVHERNHEVYVQGVPPLRLPSIATFRRRLRRIPRNAVLSARYGRGHR